jgi:hypothetical protein
MVCQKGCFSCGDHDDVKWNLKEKEFYCEMCLEGLE